MLKETKCNKNPLPMSLERDGLLYFLYISVPLVHKKNFYFTRCGSVYVCVCVCVCVCVGVCGAPFLRESRHNCFSSYLTFFRPISFFQRVQLCFDIGFWHTVTKSLDKICWNEKRFYYWLLLLILDAFIFVVFLLNDSDCSVLNQS